MAEQVGTTQLFNLNRSNLNLLLPDVPLTAHTVLLFNLIGEIRQWRIEDLAKRGHNRGSGGEAKERRGCEGVAPSRQRIFAVFTLKNTHFSTLFYRKRHAVSAVTIHNAKIFLQRMSKSRSLAKISESRLQPGPG